MSAFAWSDVAGTAGLDAGPLRRSASEACPGRTATLITDRVAALLGTGTSPLPDDLDPAERAVVELAEMFLADAHAVTDEAVRAVEAHYGAAGAVAIMVHLALTDGFTKRDVLLASRSTED